MRTAARDAARVQLAQKANNYLKQVIAQVTNVNTFMSELTNIQATITAGIASGAFDSDDLSILAQVLADWTSVQPQPLSFQQVVQSFIANPPATF